MNPYIKVILTTAIVVGVSGKPTMAQFGAPSSLSFSNMNAYLSVQQNAALVREAQRRLNSINRSNNSNRSAQTTARTQAQTAPKTTFRPVPQRLLLTQFARSLSSDPAVVRESTKAFSEGFKAFEQEARRLGRPNNVAMAFTYLVGVCYMVHYGEEPTEAALMNLQANSDAAFGSSTTFKALNSQERQKLYETFVLMATLPLAGYTVAIEQNDQELLNTYREVAGVALETALGVRPERLRFTATGLELR
ncbi:hypothetical protein H6G80_20620 [Nostoc sp. FACHB-87]|uniref:DUF6683 family protein n=1 Tax=Nostocales TaxID=1161 RepID=UPI0016889CB2|nr:MULTISPECIES: DUF6683 family protein [Nostocales]MBD2298460.1 hypothetical protein [Nostoc sp. FACHB-190]MBD2456469.1 hypothetical protein [Nostoc sp. FACHB-87]MBD2473987.1 hypothetical protein [Anabaena sp. FACHB-83]MBD2488585.1 hypothetical protein [Aulosira sp. FACHB-615]